MRLHLIEQEREISRWGLSQQTAVLLMLHDGPRQHIGQSQDAPHASGAPDDGRIAVGQRHRGIGTGIVQGDTLWRGGLQGHVLG